jgi:hypothetical protein
MLLKQDKKEECLKEIENNLNNIINETIHNPPLRTQSIQEFKAIVLRSVEIKYFSSRDFVDPDLDGPMFVHRKASTTSDADLDYGVVSPRLTSISTTTISSPTKSLKRASSRLSVVTSCLETTYETDENQEEMPAIEELSLDTGIVSPQLFSNMAMPRTSSLSNLKLPISPRASHVTYDLGFCIKIPEACTDFHIMNMVNKQDLSFLAKCIENEILVKYRDCEREELLKTAEPQNNGRKAPFFGMV